ncbi:MAG: VanW family protein [Parcubacteria group bacterium]|nr:VanW family protein [Parcubacteria group bacterium]
MRQLKDRFGGLIGRATLVPRYTWREEAVAELLAKNLSNLEHPGTDARLVILNGIASITEDREGIVFDYERALAEARKELDALVFSPIPLKLKKDVPILTRSQAEPLLPAVGRALFTEGVSIGYAGQSWFWPAATTNDLIEIRVDENGAAKLGLSQAGLLEALAPIVASIAMEAQEPKFAILGAKVVEFKAPASGKRVMAEDTWKLWERELLFERATELAPVVEVTEPTQKIADLNNLGITELLGVGKSSFAGSPPNRRHNIRVGAASVNGTLVPPGEEFSLLKTLGKVDAAAGYLPELVIKGNQTVPEYGGGLCQIGTTTFRGTLAAGLPVTARRNHSYAVSYYNDANGLPGTDATIYDPAPDYRFKNDTANYVLIATRVLGDDLFFEYWGTKDGRVSAQSGTRVRENQVHRESARGHESSI